MIADTCRRNAVRVPGRPVSGRERSSPSGCCSLANGKLPWPCIDPDKALPWVEQKTGLSLAESQVAAIRLALMSKVLVITGGPGVGKTTIVNVDPAHPRGKGRQPAAVRADRPRRQAHDRGDRVRGQDHPPAARGRSQGRRLQAQRRQPARLRPAGRRRDLHGRRHADAGADEGRARRCRAADRRRHRPAAFGRPGPGAGRHHRLRRRAGGAPDRGVPAGRAEPDHHQRPPDQPGLDARSRQARRRQRLLLRPGRRSRRPPCRASSSW